jgi:hypothetical protein
VLQARERLDLVTRMIDVVSPLINRSVWLISAMLLVCGTLFLTFGVGWAMVEALTAMKLGAAVQVTEFGRGIFGAACLSILAGVLVYVLFQRLEADEHSTVRIDFDRPIVGLHGKPLSADRWRVEARISVVARRAFAAVVHDRADEIAAAAAEALALMGPRAAHAPDRARAEKALAETVNRALRGRVVRRIRLAQVELKPAL